MSMQRAIAHVDMDAFYAAVEIRDQPALADRAVVVGGSPEGRGVVAAASYAARRHGIHSAMPARTAVRLCPELVFIRPRHDYYAEVSSQIHRILARYTPAIEPLALDEAFLDLTASQRLWGPTRDMAARIKAEIRDELGLTASVGLAPNKFLAKLASDIDKPDGLVVVEPDRIQEFLDPLPVSRLWGVGKAARARLERMGIHSIGALRQSSPALLRQELGSLGAQVWRLARGEDERQVVTDRGAKSISHETTFANDIDEWESLHAVLLELSEQVASRLRRHDFQARTVQIKVRHDDFRTVTRARSLIQPSNLTREIFDVADVLLRAHLGRAPFAVRLLGIGTSGFDASPAQAMLFIDDQRAAQLRIDEVADRINQRFGARTLHRGLRRR